MQQPQPALWSRWIRIERTDGYGPVAIVAAVGIAIGIIMAVFGLPPWPSMSPLHRYGIMDPLCGMTRGSVAILRGAPLAAWYFNPASLIVVPAGLLVLARWIYGRLTGRWIEVRLPRSRRFWVGAVLVAVLLVVLLEINQQLNAELLMQAA